jgi:uncharacterized membrane protein YtjA (UPF0391 family)
MALRTWRVAFACRNIPAAAPFDSMTQRKERKVIGFAVTLLIIAAVAAILGFGGIAGALADVAIIIFIVALIAGIVMFVVGMKAAKKLVD